MKKVLSIKEPYATLIKENQKLIETRSWKTNYRGKIYIHASFKHHSAKMDEDLRKLVANKEMNYGKIICECNLVDCVYITKDFVESLKKNNYQEYICGLYEQGRYAWILEDIKPLKIPIEVKGRLGLWNYYDEVEIMELMDSVDYGWVDKNRHRHFDFEQSFEKNYSLQAPKEVMTNKTGVCWDQVELERYYFQNWFIKTYFIAHYDDDKCPTHTFLTYEKNNKYYWFEHSWERFKGIHEYTTQKELLIDVKKKFIKYELNNQYNKNNLVIYEYSKPKYHISVLEFYKHCEQGKFMDI